MLAVQSHARLGDARLGNSANPAHSAARDTRRGGRRRPIRAGACCVLLAGRPSESAPYSRAALRRFGALRESSGGELRRSARARGVRVAPQPPPPPTPHNPTPSQAPRGVWRKRALQHPEAASAAPRRSLESRRARFVAAMPGLEAGRRRRRQRPALRRRSFRALVPPCAGAGSIPGPGAGPALRFRVFY